MKYNVIILPLFGEHKPVIACFRSLHQFVTAEQVKIDVVTFSQYSSRFRLPPRLVTTRTYARIFPRSFSFLAFGGFWKASNMSSSSSYMAGVEAVWGSIDVEVKDAPGRPDEYGETLSVAH